MGRCLDVFVFCGDRESRIEYVYGSTRTATRRGRVRFGDSRGGSPRHELARINARIPCCSGSASWYQYLPVPEARVEFVKGHQAPPVYDASRVRSGVTIGRVTRTGSADEQVNSNSPISMTRFERGDKSDCAKSEKRTAESKSGS